MLHNNVQQCKTMKIRCHQNEVPFDSGFSQGSFFLSHEWILFLPPSPSQACSLIHTFMDTFNK